MSNRLGKTYTAGGPIMELAPAPQLRLPLNGRFPALGRGAKADAHALIAKPTSPNQLPLFTPFAGHVRTEGQSLVVDRHEADTGHGAGTPRAPATTLSPAALSQLLRDHAIAGLGGAGFPAHQKLVPGLRTLIVNAVECEPGVSADQALLEARAEELVATFGQLVEVLQPTNSLFAVAPGNPQAQTLLYAAGAKQVSVAAAGHAAGSERQLIEATTGVVLARGERPAARGIACINLGTLAAIADALLRGLPLDHRVVTVSGTACFSPGNYRIPLGTPLAHVATELGNADTRAVRAGGDLTGTLAKPGMVVDHSTLAIDLMLSAPHVAVSPCIRCGQCGPVCPEGLEPWRLLEVLPSAGRSSQDARRLGLDACLLCGACSVVCPSNLPLNDLFTEARNTAGDESAGDAAAARAKARYERHAVRQNERAEARAKRLRARRRGADADSLIARARADRS